MYVCDIGKSFVFEKIVEITRHNNAQHNTSPATTHSGTHLKLGLAKRMWENGVVWCS